METDAEALTHKLRAFVRLKDIGTVENVSNISETEKCIYLTSSNGSQHRFEFDRIFSESLAQQEVYKDIGYPAVVRAVQGLNTAILSHGESGVGKTYTQLGENLDSINERSLSDSNGSHGIVFRTVEELLGKLDKLEDYDTGIACSFTEVFLDQIKDLGSEYLEEFGKRSLAHVDNALLSREVLDASASPDKNPRKSTGLKALTQNTIAAHYETENLDLTEDPNGDVVIKGCSILPIFSTMDVVNILRCGLARRAKYDSPAKGLAKKSHTIVNFTIVRRKKGEKTVERNRITFVDLAGSEKAKRGMVEELSFQEAIIINSSLNFLAKSITDFASGTSHVSYRDSKLTTLLQNTLKEKGAVYFVAHIKPVEPQFDECVSTLQYTTKLITGGAGHSRSGSPRGSVQLDPEAAKELEKKNRRLQGEVNELKRKLEYIVDDNRQKFEELQNLLGLDEDLDSILRLKPNSKEIRKLRSQREAVLQVEQLSKKNNDLEKRLRECKAQIEVVHKEESVVREQNTQRIFSLRDEVANLKEEADVTELNNRNAVQEQVNMRAEELQRMLAHSHMLLEEKSAVIQGMGTIMKSPLPDSEANRVPELKLQGRIEVEQMLTRQSRNQREVFNQQIASTKLKYETWINEKVAKLQESVANFDKYRQKKNKLTRELRKEMFSLHEAIRRNNGIIEGLQRGSYSGGGMTVFIPDNEKPEAIEETNFPIVYKLVNREKEKMRASVTGTNFVKKDVLVDTYKTDGAHTLTGDPEMMRSTNAFKESLPQEASASTAGKADIQIDLDETVDLTMKIEDLDHKELKVYAQQVINELKRNIQVTTPTGVNFTLKEDEEFRMLTAERNHFKELYQTQMRKSQLEASRYEKQKKKLERRFYSQVLSPSSRSEGSRGMMMSTYGSGFGINQAGAKTAMSFNKTRTGTSSPASRRPYTAAGML